MVKTGARSMGNRLDDLLLFKCSSLKLNASIQILCIFAHNRQINILIARAKTLIRLSGPQVCIEIESLTEGHIGATHAFTDRGSNGTLQSDFCSFNRFDNFIGQNGTMLL